MAQIGFSVLSFNLIYCRFVFMVKKNKKIKNKKIKKCEYCIDLFSDYVVHLSNAYLECESNERNDRIVFSLFTMGISVVSGAITTFASGVFLTFPEMLFFKKFFFVFFFFFFSFLFSFVCIVGQKI